MPGWRDFLDRFRPAGAPGAASPGRIPIDRAAAVAAELMPLLERLDAVQDEAERLRAAARERAGHLRCTGSDDAAALVRKARECSETVAAQADTAAKVVVSHEAAIDTPDAAAEVTRRATERLPAYVGLVVAEARELIAELCATAAVS